MRLSENERTVMGMDEYIKLAELMKFPIRRNHYDKEHGNEDFICGIETVLEYAENLPAADVAPVRHGRWKCNKPCPVCGGDRFDGLDADIWADWQPPYCPNCGAKMDMRGTVNNNANKEIG